MMDDPEVTIEPADNGYVVRHYRKSTKRDEPGRTIRQVAATADEALGHAGKVLGGGKAPRKKHQRDEGAAAEGVIGAHAMHGGAHSGRHHVRRRSRSGARR